MAKNQITTIDIGTNSVKVLQLELTQTGVILVNSGVESYPRQSATEKIPVETIIDTLSQLVSNKGFRTKPAAISVPRHDITVKMLAGLPATAADEDIKKMVPIQVEPELPFAIADAVYSSYNLQHSPDGASLEVAATKRTSVEKYIDIAEKVGLKLKTIIPSSFATYGVVFDQLKDQLAGRTLAIADIGAGMTDICIIQHGRLAFSRSFTFGGNNLTSAFEKEYEIPFQMAEERKFSEANLEPNAEDSITGRWAENLAIQITQSLRAFTGEEANGIDSLWLCGGSSLVTGLANYLANRLSIEVKVWNPAQEMQDQTLGEELQSGLSVAIGLGIIGAAGEKRTPTVNVNLLPREITEGEDRARQKIKISIIAALAFVILVGAGLGFGVWRHSRTKLYESVASRLESLEKQEETRNSKAALENSILMQQITTPYVSPLEILQEMSGELPNRRRIALTNLNIDKKGKVTMGVEATSHADVSDMIQVLSELKVMSKAKLFDEVKHGAISRVKKDNRSILQVQISCALNENAM